MAMATPIYTADQGDYRMAQQCGADDITAEDVAVSYRLDGAGRPIERVGHGWSVFGLQAGSVLESGQDVEQMRRLLAGRSPDGDQLVKPKLAVAPEAKLQADVFCAALQAAAADRDTTIEELLAGDPWSLKRAGRLIRGVRREGERHRVPVLDVARMATAAGLDPRRGIYELDEWKQAWDQRHERVQVGVSVRSVSPSAK